MWACALLIFSSLHVAYANESAAVFLNANGQDPRSAMSSTSFPWSAIGQLSHLDSEGILHLCTATLVGPDVLVTAAHCVLDGNGKIAPVHFKANLRNGAFLAEADSVNILVGTMSPDQEKDADWAAVKLGQRLGDHLQFMHISNAGIANLPNTVSFAGYSADFQAGAIASVVIACTVHSQLPDGTFAHDCSTDEGASGGPLFKFDPARSAATLVAIHTRGFSKESFAKYDVTVANIAVMQDALLQAVLKLRATKFVANPNIGLYINSDIF